MNYKLLLLTAICALSHTLHSMNRVPTLQQLAAKPYADYIAQQSSSCNLMDSNSVDSILEPYAGLSELTLDAIAEGLRHKLGAPFLTLQGSFDQDDNNPLVYHDCGALEMIYTIDPSDYKLFSVGGRTNKRSDGKAYMKVLSWFQGKYHKTDLVELPNLKEGTEKHSWRCIVLNSVNKDVIIQTYTGSMIVLQLNQDGYYEITQTLEPQPDGHFDYYTQVSINQRTGELFCIGKLNDNSYFSPATHLIHIWKRDETGHYIEQPLLFRSSSHLHKKIMHDPIANTLMIISMNRDEGCFFMHVFQNHHEGDGYQLLQSINLGNEGGNQGPHIVYVHDQKKGELLIDLAHYSKSNHEIVRLLRQEDSRYAKTSISLQAPRTVVYHGSFAYNYDSMIYDQPTHSLLYLNNHGQQTARFNLSTGQKLFESPISDRVLNKTPRHSLVAVNNQVYIMGAAHSDVYKDNLLKRLQNSVIHFYKAGLRELYVAPEHIALLQTLDLRQLILLDSIHSQVSMTDQLAIHADYKDDFKIIAPLLHEKIQKRIHFLHPQPLVKFQPGEFVLVDKQEEESTDNHRPDRSLEDEPTAKRQRRE